MRNRLSWIGVVVGGCLACGASFSAWPADVPKGDPYLLGVCAVTGKSLADLKDPVIYAYEGRELRFADKAALETFKKDPAPYIKKTDEAIIKQQTPLYPLDTCIESGEKLGGMGEAIDYVYKNRLVRFCCKGCIAKFEKDPATYLAKLDAAVVEKQKAKYPLTTCPVMGGKIEEGKSVDYVAGNRLVRFCCPGCIQTFEKNPEKYLSKIDGARGNK